MTLFEYSAAPAFPQLENHGTILTLPLTFQWVTVLVGPEVLILKALSGTFSYSLPSSGSPNTIVVRAFYEWPLFVTRLGYNIGNLNGGKRLLSATAAFHVEP